MTEKRSVIILGCLFSSVQMMTSEIDMATNTTGTTTPQDTDDNVHDTTRPQVKDEGCTCMGAGAIIGALIGGILLAFLIMVGIIFVLHFRQRFAQQQNNHDSGHKNDTGAKGAEAHRGRNIHQPSILDTIRGQFRGNAHRRNNIHINKSYDQEISGERQLHKIRDMQDDYELTESQKFKGDHSKVYDLANLNDPNLDSGKPSKAGTISYDHIGQVKPCPNTSNTHEEYDIARKSEFKGDNPHEYYNLKDRDLPPKKPDIPLPGLPEIYENITLQAN